MNVVVSRLVNYLGCTARGTCRLETMKADLRVPTLYFLSTLCNTAFSGAAAGANCAKSNGCGNGVSGVVQPAEVGNFRGQCSDYSTLQAIGGPREIIASTYPHKAWCEVVFQQNYFDRLDAGACYSSLSGSDGLPHTDIDYEMLMSMIKSKDIQLIDVREPEEVSETGMMPGAVNVPLGEIEEALQLDKEAFEVEYGVAMPSKTDSNIVFSCLGGVRSRMALNSAHELGYNRARHYIGGWDEYEEKMKS